MVDGRFKRLKILALMYKYLKVLLHYYYAHT